MTTKTETEPEYIDENTILNYVCPNGSLGATTWAMWEKGDRCNCDLCRKDRAKLNKKKSKKRRLSN